MLGVVSVLRMKSDRKFLDVVIVGSALRSLTNDSA